MDNLGELLESLSESDIENLKGIAKDLFSGEGGASALPSGADLSALGALLQSGEDDRCKLIRALKPMLSPERRHRADEAVKLLRLASLLPALKESGILEQFFGESNS